ARSTYYNVAETLKQRRENQHSKLSMGLSGRQKDDMRETYTNIPELAELPENDQLAWQVCAILCDESLKKAQRLELFKTWMRESILSDQEKAIVQARKDKDPWAMGFIYLTFGRTTDACEIALQQGDYPLAALFANPDREYAREAAHKQIRLWQRDHTFENMSQYQQKMWYVLNGQLGYCAHSQFVVTENLDWRQTLGLYVWYSSHTWHSLQEVIRLHDSALDKTLPGIHHQYVLKHTAQPSHTCMWYNVVRWWSYFCKN
ncbi:hypothetical protein DFQ28_011417, partial [Apophysomyces sp. BC1034]